MNGNEANISMTGTAPLSNTLTINFTFTPNFNFSGTATGGNADIPLFYLNTANGNNPLLSLDMNVSRDESNDWLTLGTGIQFSGGTTTGTTIFKTPGIDSLAGLTLTINDVETYTNTGGNDWTITNNGTISNGATVLFTINTSTSGTANNDSYDPVNNPLSLAFGLTNGQFGGGSNPTAGFLDSGANVVFSSVDIVAGAVPEPSTYALLGLGFVVLIVVTRSRRFSSAG